ncbi:alpha/beta fold hydrolase [Altibacter sp. HG106]|uniref:alpha/beta fold hydrolase n=1 Tax=Altibacter sp. HG106 TaxID=3023937 RepID=UPI00300FCE56
MKTINISHYKTESGFVFDHIPLSYECFGRPLNQAPVVLVNHALTGNSHIAGDDGWWNTLIGEGKCIDTTQFSVLCFNVPGNGYNGFLIENYTDLSVLDVAQLFLKGIDILQIESLFAVIGGSLGGTIAWQLAALRPQLVQHLIPIASDWKASDWVIAQCRIQKQILKHSEKPLQDARMHAMTFYRTPQSLGEKFNRRRQESTSIYAVESWLFYHGKRLETRFQLQAYQLMNHLLTTANIARQTGNFIASVKDIAASVHLIGINTDGFYTNDEILDTYKLFSKIKTNLYYHQINSIHGHDAFLIEFDQLSTILSPIFQQITPKKQQYECATIE